MTDETRLRLRGAEVRYAGRSSPAISGVTLDVSAGERFGVTGRTAAGKSTLALLASGFIPRVIRATTSGTVSIDGVDALDASDAAALLGRVGIVFATPANQLSASKPTVREELAFGLENLAVPRDEMDARIDMILDRLGITHLAGREPFALSGGEQQRVAIASIVTMGTRLLVLDEPTAQLDPVGTADTATLLDELAASGTAVLCVEHDPVVLARMDRVAVLDSGRVVGIDRPATALGRTIAGTVGLPSPTLVRIAEAAGLDTTSALDPGLVAAALAALGGRRAIAGLGDRDADVPPTAWSPVGRRDVPTIEIEGLVHHYPGGIEALRGVSLVIEPGDGVAIVGRNGSGKTTLAKHLDGLLRPHAGVVSFDGRSVAAEPVNRLAATVGFAFQNPDDQLFERTVEREVAFGPRNLGFDATRVAALVTNALDAVGLTQERLTNPYDLDLARRKLVALACVLAMDPAILVLDEPTTGQDPEGVGRVAGIVRAWRAAGRTAIAITHDVEFAADAFDRIVVMRGGEILMDGSPGRVLSASNAALLATTGLTPPPAAQVAGAMGISTDVVDVTGLLAALRPPADAGR